MSVEFTEPGDVLSFEQAIGTDGHTWTSKDGTKTCTFGRPKGLVSLTIAAVLGPQQAANPVLETYYRAAAGVRTLNGTAIPQPRNDLQFHGIFGMFGDDETLNDYVMAYNLALHPELQEALNEANALGAGPDTVARIMKNAGTEQAKKSPRRGSSTQS